jgi:hypothetical protein
MQRTLARRSLLKTLCSAVGAAALLPVGAAQSPEDERLHSDWPYLARYRDQNLQLKSSGVRIDAVFMGDSITEGWLQKAPAFFIPGRICRGIGGQTTPQMLLRFRQDVIDLQPRVVHIMAGTNDIAGNTGPSTLKMTQDNFLCMSEIAMANKVHLIFASIPPAAHCSAECLDDGASAAPASDLRRLFCGHGRWQGRHARRPVIRPCPSDRSRVCGDAPGGRSGAGARVACRQLALGGRGYYGCSGDACGFSSGSARPSRSSSSSASLGNGLLNR